MKPALRADDAGRRALIENIFIEFPRFAAAREMIAHCHEHSKISAEPECLLITGWQGAGKTTLYRSYARNHPRRVTGEGTIVPVLATSIPVPATATSLASEMLFAMGDPAPSRGTTAALTLRLRKQTKECGVELIILDEFQHFIDRDSNSVLVTASNWLKNLLDRTNRPVVLLGMPYSELILRANSQLERRFAARLSLDPFGWEPAARREEFRAFLAKLDRALPLPESSGLSRRETAFRLYYATYGFIGYLMKLVRRAALLAVERGEERVGLPLLAEAYEERLAARAPLKRNPFTESLDGLSVEPFDQWEDARKNLKRLLKGLG